MKAEISVLEGQPKGATLPLEEPRSYSIGRSSTNDLVLKDRNVSRQHCTIQHDGDFFWLIDAQSANGTRVNGAKVQRYLLFNGDVIQLGNTKLVFRVQEENEQRPPHPRPETPSDAPQTTGSS